MNVLAIHRQGVELRNEFGEVKLSFGDTLLMEGHVGGINVLQREGDFVTLSQAYRAIHWEISFLIFGMLALGKAMESSKAAQLVVNSVSGVLEGASPHAFLAVLYLLCSFLTELITNNAVAALIAPLAIGVAESLGVDARPFLVATMFGCSASFATPIDYQTNTYVYLRRGWGTASRTLSGSDCPSIFPSGLSPQSSVFIPIFWPFYPWGSELPCPIPIDPLCSPSDRPPSKNDVACIRQNERFAALPISLSHCEPSYCQSNRPLAMIRRILVPLDGSAFTETATKHACDIARHTGAEVFGKIVTEDSNPLSITAPSHAQAARWAAETHIEDWKEEKRRINKTFEHFDDTCKGAGVKYQRAHLQGVPVKMLIAQTIFYDLVVTGFHGEMGANIESRRESVGTLIGTSITPFLVVPRRYREIKNVLICFDGSLPSMRALQDFASFVDGSHYEVTVLTADKKKEEAEFLLQRATEYLRSYGIEEYRTMIENREIREAVREYNDGQFDLIVVGAHSRHVVRDLFAGSLITELFEQARTPLLIGQ